MIFFGIEEEEDECEFMADLSVPIKVHWELKAQNYMLKLIIIVTYGAIFITKFFGG